MSRIAESVEAANRDGRMALAIYLTAGYPTKEDFEGLVPDLAPLVDLIEIGVPFSDPMADGVSIQHASFEALKNGVTLEWIFEVVDRLKTATPLVLMSYLNPLLAYGQDRLVDASAKSGVSGFIIPDLPYEESGPTAKSLFAADLDLVQMVTPATPDDRMRILCAYSRGFVYAVTRTGTTGGNVQGNDTLTGYLDRVRVKSHIPVLAGFGIRAPQHIRAIAGHANGVVVGSAIVDALKAGDDVLRLVQQLKDATRAHNEVST
jgi:tryptophan synthase alpha chain